jgi:hypothetical protein
MRTPSTKRRRETTWFSRNVTPRLVLDPFAVVLFFWLRKIVVALEIRRESCLLTIQIWRGCGCNKRNE